MNSMNNIVSDFINLIYPRICLICGENLIRHENQICLKCIQNIPRTHFHLHPDNPVEKRFWGKVEVFRASSFFFFEKGSPFRKLLHELKYKDNPEIGVIMGRLAASELLQSADFQSITTIVPVPLHPNKLRKRGYNQSECIARGLSEILEKPVELNLLKKIHENTTQTRKGVYERFENTTGIFEALTEIGADEHLLLVDDVLTTGSTLEACVAALLQKGNVKVSIFTLAVA